MTAPHPTRPVYACCKAPYRGEARHECNKVAEGRNGAPSASGLDPRMDKSKAGPGLGRSSATPRAGKSWSNATSTVCAAGHRHPSKMEARVCDRLTVEAADCGATLYRQVRLPLFSLAPTDSGLPHYITVDFVMELPSNIVHKTRRYIDAKHPKRVSPEWRRGAAAFQSCYGAKIEEVAS